MRSHIARRLKAGKWCGTKFRVDSYLIPFCVELSQQIGHNQNNSQSNGQDQQGGNQQQAQSEAPGQSQIMQIQQNC